jgi:hypothetical protein
LLEQDKRTPAEFGELAQKNYEKIGYIMLVDDLYLLDRTESKTGTILLPRDDTTALSYSSKPGWYPGGTSVQIADQGGGLWRCERSRTLCRWIPEDQDKDFRPRVLDQHRDDILLCTSIWIYRVVRGEDCFSARSLELGMS